MSMTPPTAATKLTVQSETRLLSLNTPFGSIPDRMMMTASEQTPGKIRMTPRAISRNVMAV
jgi:hypothetical protein